MEHMGHDFNPGKPGHAYCTKCGLEGRYATPIPYACTAVEVEIRTGSGNMTQREHDETLFARPSPDWQAKVPARVAACECGATKALGVRDYAPGHSSWCPVKK